MPPLLTRIKERKLAQWGLAYLAGALHAFTLAAAELEDLIASDPEDERYHAAVGHAYAGLGRSADAVREATLATELLPVEKDALHGPMQLFALAAVQARVGNRQEALDILERLLTMPSLYTVAKLRTNYLLTSLHDDLAFIELVEREPGTVF
jgi:serine/threonine-protein kinase